MSDAAELERLSKELAELRALVRDLSARQAAVVAALPLEAALSLATGGEAGLEPPFRLEHWDETAEMTRAEIASDLTLLWRRLSPREGA